MRAGINPGAGLAVRAVKAVMGLPVRRFYRQYMDAYGVISKNRAKRFYDAYVHLPVEFGMAEDGHRPVSEKFRRLSDALLIQALEELGLPYHVVGGTVQERVSKIIEIHGLPRVMPLDEAIAKAQERVGAATAVLEQHARVLAAERNRSLLADRLGRRRVFTAGFVLFTVASLACGLAGSITTLALARAVQGAGAAVLFAVGPALIGEVVHGKARAAAFGVFGAGAGLAIAAGPLIGGALTSGPGWRWIFLVNVPIGVTAAAAGARRMHESAADRPHPADWPGLATISPGAVCHGRAAWLRRGRVILVYHRSSRGEGSHDARS